MAFLSKKSLLKIIPDENVISNFDPNRLKSTAYELAMGDQAYVTTDETKKTYKQGEQVVIRPGQFAVLITDEKVNIPLGLIAFISIKFSIKFEGLVNVSGFHVDPGFKGRIKFSVYNAGSQNVVISSGQPIFQIWFAALDSSDSLNKYNGDHNLQEIISDKDVMRIQGEIASPSMLKRRIDKMETKIKILLTLGCALLVSVIILLLSATITAKSANESSLLNSTEETIHFSKPHKTETDTLWELN